MNRTCGIICVAAITFLMSIAGAMATYELQSFTGSQGGIPGTISPRWTTGQSYYTNVPYAGSTALAIPGLATVSNGVADATEKVWTDFWTIPTKYSNGSVTAPDIDTTATVQFFVNSNGYWVAFSGNGPGVYKTNVLDRVLSGTDTNYPVVTNNPSYYRVSILSDYAASTKQYSFFVNDKCLGTNLAFMCTPDSTRWFQMQNLSKNSDEVCLLDEYLLTNSMSSVLTTPITGGEISQSDAVYYFGTVEPRPAVTNATAPAGTANVVWRFSTAGVGTCIIEKGPTPSAFGNAQTFDGNDQLLCADLNGSDKYFYRIIRQSIENPSVLVTNKQIYAAYKQTRERNRNYIVGVPVIPLGTNTLAGPMGQQLAKGVAPGDKLTVYIGGTPYSYTRDEGSLSWTKVGSAPLSSALTLTPGMGVLIQVVGDNSADKTTILAGIKQTNTVAGTSVAHNTWNIFAWPYETTGTLGATITNPDGTDNTAAGYANSDYAWIQQVGTLNPIQARCVGGVWRQFFNSTSGPILTDLTLKAGDGIMYHGSATSGAMWAPVQ